MHKKRKKIIITVFMILCILLMIYSAINITIWFLSRKRNNTITEEIKEIIDESNSNSNNNDYGIDFAKLKEKNSEIVAYLKVNNTNIDHVVVHGNDNKYYLKHNLYKEYSVFGAIFIDYRNKLDGNDKNLIIYGHNTRDGSMFGTLRRVITKDWYQNEDNHIINLVLEDKVLTYQVFSTYSIIKEDYYISTKFKDTDEFNRFVNKLKSRSVYDYKVTVDGNDSILTLSTCTGNGKSRMVLHAKLINNI